MYNILLTDDEQIVIDSLSFIINENFEGQVNTYTALSGTQALEVVTNNKIDIIFMDINMPGINGLETISCITKLKPDTVIIMLSAFDKFQYAQEAMNIGAFKYLTKPFNKNTIIQTIRSAMDLIDSKKDTKITSQELNKKIDLVSPILESDFIYLCIFNNEDLSKINTYFEYYNISKYPFYFYCIELPYMSIETQESKQAKIKEIINKKQKSFIGFFNTNRAIVLSTISEQNYKEEAIQNTIKEIYKELSYAISSEIKIGASTIQTETKNISETYNEALLALYKTTLENKIIFYNSISDSTANIPVHEFKDQLLTRLIQGDKVGMQSFLDLYTKNLFSKEEDINKIKNSLFELLITAKNKTKKIVENFEDTSFDNAFSFLISEDNLPALKNYVQNKLLECTTSINSIKKQIENPIIKKICAYINQNLSEDISLEQMAEYTNVSSFYLSKLFKEEKGVTFITFITDTRLDKAQKLLKETELSIKEITAQIGYNDQNYFSRIFKNKFGITPSEARKKL